MTQAQAWLLFGMQHLLRVVININIAVENPSANIVPPFSAFRHPRTEKAFSSQLIPKALYLTRCSMKSRMGVGRWQIVNLGLSSMLWAGMSWFLLRISQRLNETVTRRRDRRVLDGSNCKYAEACTVGRKL
jgi:hypothetical protein